MNQSDLLTLKERLTLRAQQAPPADWLPVMLLEQHIGHAHPDVASFIATQTPAQLIDYQLLLDDPQSNTELTAALRDALLADVATQLHTAGWLRGWRNELLDVRPLTADVASPVLARMERAACRPLGIATHAVHMNAFTPQGELWVAQRASNKSIDPGLWDNLVGGMVASGESALAALTRETMEEAGLDIAVLNVQRGSLLYESRPVPEGHMVETIQVFHAVLPQDAQPQNRDGEVQKIEVWSVERVLQAIASDAFTLEAALVVVDGLLHFHEQAFSR